MIAQSTRVGNATRCAHFGRRALWRISGLLVEVSFGARRVIPIPEISVGSRFSKRTLVGTLGNGRDAPKAAVRLSSENRLKSRPPGSKDQNGLSGCVAVITGGYGHALPDEPADFGTVGTKMEAPRVIGQVSRAAPSGVRL